MRRMILIGFVIFMCLLKADIAKDKSLKNVLEIEALE